MVLISHEMPFSLMKKKQDEYNDYLYVLLHRYLKGGEYADFADNYKGSVLLDNSCYELGESLSNEILYATIHKLRPTWFVLPDTLGNKEKTIQRSTEFLMQYDDFGGAIPIGVAQGASGTEIIDCYKYFRDRFKNIVLGFPFVFSWVDKHSYSQTQNRIDLLKYMLARNIIDKSRNHHLFGTWQAREFRVYRHFDWIKTIDTSNPIMGALEGTKYGPGGIYVKPKLKFDDVFDLPLNKIDVNLVDYNVKMFRNIANGVDMVDKKEVDRVNSPSHYNIAALEVIDIIDMFDLNFAKGNCVKYVLRAGYKAEDGLTKEEKEIEDLEKAVWYLQHEVKRLRKELEHESK